MESPTVFPVTASCWWVATPAHHPQPAAGPSFPDLGTLAPRCTLLTLSSVLLGLHDAPTPVNTSASLPGGPSESSGTTWLVPHSLLSAPLPAPNHVATPTALSFFTEMSSHQAVTSVKLPLCRPLPHPPLPRSRPGTLHISQKLTSTSEYPQSSWVCPALCWAPTGSSKQMPFGPWPPGAAGVRVHKCVCTMYTRTQT